MKRPVAHLIRFSLSALALLGFVVGIVGEVWAVAVLMGVAAAFLLFEASRRLHPKFAQDDLNVQPWSGFRRDLDDPDPIRLAIGNLILFAVILVVAIDGGVPIWTIVLAVVMQSVWVAAMILRRRRKKARPARIDAPR